MFRRPWHIWLAYLAILALLLPGVAWLSVRVRELDRQEQLARRRAEQERNVSLALWRMESVAMPIIAAEAARPHSAYRPYQTLTADNGSSRVASPLLQSPSEFVLLSFEIGVGNLLISPQCPSDDDKPWALENGLTPESMLTACVRVEQLQERVSFDELLSQLPEADLLLAPELAPPGGENSDAARGNSYVVNSNIAQAPEPPPGIADGRQDFQNRSTKLQQLAQQSARDQRNWLEVTQLPLDDQVREGVSRPLWIEDKLILARRVERQGEQRVQGCWLNWERLREHLSAEFTELVPGADLRPVPAGEKAAPGRTLASLPVEMTVPALDLTPPYDDATALALYAAWSGVTLACLAIGLLLYGVMKLSERRAAFVSAVTHELRTPLTTFQMYTEMLAGGMVADEAARREYLDTLHRESGRLSHLIDNVLAYARLERRPVRRPRESVSLEELLDGARARLDARAAQAGLALNCDVTPEAQAALVRVEPTVVEQILLNLVDNACKYGRSDGEAHITLSAECRDRSVLVRLRDCGRGISPGAASRLFRPFSKSDFEAAQSAPGLGLGLSLSRALARGEGGDLVLLESSAAGTTFELSLPIAGFDARRPAPGAVATTDRDSARDW